MSTGQSQPPRAATSVRSRLLKLVSGRWAYKIFSAGKGGVDRIPEPHGEC
jgi:hypothetical protein